MQYERRYFYRLSDTPQEGLRWMLGHVFCVKSALQEAYARTKVCPQDVYLLEAISKIRGTSRSHRVKCLSNPTSFACMTRQGHVFGWTQHPGKQAKMKLGLVVIDRKMTEKTVDSLRRAGWIEQTEVFGLFRALKSNLKIGRDLLEQGVNA